MLIIDAHLDMAMNAVEWNRDYTCSVQELREREIEKNLTDKRDRAFCHADQIHRHFPYQS